MQPAVLLFQSSYIGPKATNLRTFNEGLYSMPRAGGFVDYFNGSSIFLSSPVGARIFDPMMTLRFIVGDIFNLWSLFS